MSFKRSLMKDLRRRTWRKLKKLSAQTAQLHVVPRTKTGRWVIRRKGAVKAARVFETKKVAVYRAKKMAASGGFNKVLVHGNDGTITRSIEIKMIKGVSKSVKTTAKVLKSATKKKSAAKK